MANLKGVDAFGKVRMTSVQSCRSVTQALNLQTAEDVKVRTRTGALRMHPRNPHEFLWTES